MSLTDYGENWMLNAFKSGGTYYLGLFTSIPGEAGGGNEGSGGADARLYRSARHQVEASKAHRLLSSPLLRRCGEPSLHGRCSLPQAGGT